MSDVSLLRGDVIPAGVVPWNIYSYLSTLSHFILLTHIQSIIPISLPLKNEQAFVVPSIGQPALTTSTTSLDASRLNAKQEKRKRNRENMRKFKKGGRKGTSRKKMMRKLQSSAQRQVSCQFANYIYLVSLQFKYLLTYLQSNRTAASLSPYLKVENEFVAKCFITVPPPNSDESA